MKEKLDILFLSGWYPSRVNPTLGNFVQKHAEAVALYDNVTAIHVSSDPSCKKKYEITDQQINGVRTINVYYRKVHHNIPLLSGLQKLRRYFKAHTLGISLAGGSKNFDLVHHNILYPAGIIAYRIKKKYGIPYIITENWTGYLPSKNIRLGTAEAFFSRLIARNASCITPVSIDLEKAMKKLAFDAPYEVIYNVMDTRLFHPQENKEKNQRTRFLHISTLDDDHKNISGMLRVISKMAKERKDFSVLFAGDGDSAPYEKIAAKNELLPGIVKFEGTKSTSEVAEMMRNADCFLMFSNYENLPCVIVEALASGLPVVSSTAGGIPEHITADKGILVAPRDEEALHEAMNAMIGKIRSGWYDPIKLSRYAADNFSYEKTGKKFHELYRRILAAPQYEKNH